MLYPQKISSKKIDKIASFLRNGVIALSIILLIINYMTTPSIYWSHLCIAGFIYIYFTVRYSITRTRNIAGYVMIQTLFLAIIMFFVDYRIGYNGWSINISIPILIIINYKDYGKYAISQLIIVLLSLSMIIFIYKGFAKVSPLINISIFISIFNFVVSVVLCHRDFKEEIIRKLNI